MVFVCFWVYFTYRDEDLKYLGSVCVYSFSVLVNENFVGKEEHILSY